MAFSLRHVQLISCMLVSYPLGNVFVRIPSSSPELRHLFSIAVSFFFTCVVLDLWGGFIQLLASTLATYFVSKNVKGREMPWIVFACVTRSLHEQTLCFC